MPFATEIHPTSTSPIESEADLVAFPVGFAEGGPVPVTAGAGLDRAALAERLPADPGALLSFYEFAGKAGEIRELPADLGRGLVRLVFFGVGSGSMRDLRKAGAALARHARGRRRVSTTLPALVAEAEGTSESRDAALSAFVEAVLLAGYTFTLAAAPGGPRPVPAVDLVTTDPSSLAAPVDRGRAIAEATALARDLVNTPSLEKGPQWLADRAVETARSAGLHAKVWDEEALAREGFGAILAVGRGAPRPPRLVQLGYEPAGATRHVVLVGKGITFDTGGLSLKPTDNMKLMKTDMAGAAVVLGVMSRLSALGSPVRVTALLPLAENAFSGRAQRPGDVLTTYDGTTVEVLNTDAEGRLVLADALAYAAAELNPDTLLDVATLTGAAKVALGTATGALYATDDPLSAALLDCAARSGEPLWRMPLVESYADGLASRVADLANIGTESDYGRPGSIEAALFLRGFTGGVPWAHLDIAGPARATKDRGEITKGGTGFGTRLLLHWLEN